MRKAYLRWSVLAVLFLGALVSPRAFAGEAESPVDDEMEALNSAVRKANRHYADAAKKDSTLTLIAEMQAHVQAAKKLSPSKAAKLTGAEKTKYVATYQKNLDDLLADIATLKDAVAGGNADLAKLQLEKIGQLKESSHKELGIEEKKDKK